ncbi:hypothetical protein AYI68_g7756 [Smittium mucronatum]|uniref:Reverse transcriptase domain-containing protein n=1 Tax=Smittium mucronatum TaxID=133383 RepID=A0A1R0GMV5_9FUNG|nr:hypothetical protein AYI68_g7756 [Smittium mucronatum]
MTTSIVVPVPKKDDLKNPDNYRISPSSKYICGIRQGCLASPILFDFYINDIFKDLIGIEVPEIDLKIPRLLFTDNAVLLVDSKKNLKKSLDTITVCSDTWEMKIKAKKCGTMDIGIDCPNIPAIQIHAVVRS